MILQVNGLSKSFGEKAVLKDVSFHLQTGEVLAIIGPSGAGKTTILRCITGLEKSDRGTIKIDESYLCRDSNNKSLHANPDQLKLIRQNIGMVFQNYNLFPHMSVMENIVEAPVNAFGISKNQAKNKALELLDVMGLVDKKDSYPFELSGGQQQRVAIARACALNPKIMCLDEPTSALDPELREGIANIVKDLARDNMGILIITHDMAFAERVADRIIFMEDGVIVKEDDKKDFFNNLKDDRIKRFIT